MSRAPEPGWARLDWRTVLVRPVSTLLRLVPALFGVLVLGSGSGLQLWFAVGAAVLLVAVGVIAYTSTRFRVTEQQVELRSGLVVRRAQATPRDRVRTVEATAPPLHRLLGVVRVRIGTGTASGGDSELMLDAVSHRELEVLRAALLHRGAAPRTSDDAGAPLAATPEDTELMRWQPAWARYAPLSTTGVVAVAAVFGVGFQAADQLGVGRSSVGSVGRLVTGTDPVLLAAVGVLLLAGLSVLLAVAINVEGWWGARLTRSADASLRMSRGLLTTRSVTVEQARLRGATTSEPLLVRAAGAARADAVVSGLGPGGGGGGSAAALTPAAPREAVDGVVAQVLGGADAVRPVWRTHPPAARRRRLVRTLVPLFALVLAVLVAGPPWWVPVLVAVLGLPGALALALDRARSLGHTVSGEHLVVREGSLVRRTTALRCTGIIGITVRRSVFQRRAGVATVSATTAAGSGSYALLDVGLGAGLAAAEQAVPGLLTPFLTSTPAPGSVPSQG